jgi:hypothetical protein
MAQIRDTGIPNREWRTHQVRHIRSFMNMEEEFAPQVVDIVDSIGLTNKQWQEEEIYLVPPLLSHVAVLTLLEIWKRSSVFPKLIRITKEYPESDNYVVAEVISLEEFLSQDNSSFNQTYS